MPTGQSDLISLVHNAIDPGPLLGHVRSRGDGAIVTFDGFVRDHSKNRRTLYLEYEAYEAMAISKLREIATHLHLHFSFDRLAMVHRLGRLEIGDCSVFIAVSSAHRAAAFEACRYAIDTLKRTVPIWKKEYFEDGSVWAEGELPPTPQAAAPATPAPESAS
jgi:molybdopterin synthase catalytic subunit